MEIWTFIEGNWMQTFFRAVMREEKLLFDKVARIMSLSRSFYHTGSKKMRCWFFGEDVWERRMLSYFILPGLKRLRVFGLRLNYFDKKFWSSIFSDKSIPKAILTQQGEIKHMRSQQRSKTTHNIYQQYSTLHMQMK